MEGKSLKQVKQKIDTVCQHLNLPRYSRARTDDSSHSPHGWELSVSSHLPKSSIIPLYLRICGY